MLTLFIIWLVGYIATTIYARHRVWVNHRRGLIRDPYQLEGMAVEFTMCVIWPYTVPKLIYLWLKEPNAA